MTAITDQFGRESHVIMGAVIDEGMQNRVEVCVLGTSDMGSRSVPPRRPVPARGKAPVARPEAATAAPAPAPTPAPAELVAAAPVTHTTASKAGQDEFGFGEVESRGHFEKTDRNLFDGQDLDVPTYLRKGIKIAL
jgi:cell division protein FtsZ